jgi:hypothetical protein
VEERKNMENASKRQIAEEKIRKLASLWRITEDCSTLNARPIMIDECDYSPSDG